MDKLLEESRIQSVMQVGDPNCLAAQDATEKTILSLRGIHMKTFNVYQHPTQGFEAVKLGFSWPAFFFGMLWMLFKRLWGLAAIWFGAYVVCSFVEAFLNSAQAGADLAMGFLLILAAYFVLWLLPAFKGNQWREENLARRGYRREGTVQAETADAAVAQLARTASPGTMAHAA